MNYLRGAVNAISAPYQYYKDINPSTLTGAIDVIVVKRPNSTGDPDLACTPFHVRFGKWQVLRPSEKKVRFVNTTLCILGSSGLIHSQVDVTVNGKLIPFNMKVGEAGEAFFVFETEEDVPEELITSPILQPTRPEGVKVDGKDQLDQLSALQRDKDKEGDNALERAERLDLNQEPDFLDLNASEPTSLTDESAQRKTRSSLSNVQPGRIIRSLPSTPFITPSDVLGQDRAEIDSLSRAVDQATASHPADGEAPPIIYTPST
jgi:phosphatidate phosphatase LPIN